MFTPEWAGTVMIVTAVLAGLTGVGLGCLLVWLFAEPTTPAVSAAEAAEAAAVLTALADKLAVSNLCAVRNQPEYLAAAQLWGSDTLAQALSRVYRDNLRAQLPSPGGASLSSMGGVPRCPQISKTRTNTWQNRC